MKLLYQGDTPIDRQRNRKWFAELCWDAIGVVLALASFWALVILMYVM